MLEKLKRDVYAANLKLVSKGLVIETFGNVSGVDRSAGVMVIKPSGVPYDTMSHDQMVPVSLETGDVIESDLRPSTDTPTHLELYRAFADIGGVVHTHSLYASAWAQAQKSVPALGTTHADHFHGAVPCTRALTDKEITTDYEANTGKVIVERFSKTSPLAAPAVLVAEHGPFAWGKTPDDAVHNAFILEHLAQLAMLTQQVNDRAKPIGQTLLDKHFLRKHGPDAYYGQK